MVKVRKENVFARAGNTIRVYDPDKLLGKLLVKDE
jgi:hypothetical protein